MAFNIFYITMMNFIVVIQQSSPLLANTLVLEGFFCFDLYFISTLVSLQSLAQHTQVKLYSFPNSLLAR